jgi:hypothetical protein
MNESANNLRLEQGFYEFTDSLRFIEDEALFRMVAPDALLFSLLTRISASIPPAYLLPAFVGSNATASLLSAIVGSAGIGKSQANSAARELFPVNDERFRFDLPNGTGQGMIEAYLRPAKKHEAGFDEGKKIQQFEGCHFYIDEGSNLVSLGSKKEDITLDTIRSLWSGESVGQTNASATTSRYLPARSVAFGLSVGFQPDIAAMFVKEGENVGTPQRFLWCYAHNDEQPDHAPKPKGTLDALILPRRDTPFEFKFDPSIQHEIRNKRAQLMRREITFNAYESHDSLKQMKVAACLAILHRTTHVDTQTWALAGNIVEVSANVLQDIRKTFAEKQLEQRASKNDERAESIVRVNEKTREQAIKAGAATMARKAHKELSQVGATFLSQAVSGNDKRLATTDEMIDYALNQSWLEEIPTKGTPRYKAGRVTPPAANRN